MFCFSVLFAGDKTLLSYDFALNTNRYTDIVGAVAALCKALCFLANGSQKQK